MFSISYLSAFQCKFYVFLAFLVVIFFSRNFKFHRDQLTFSRTIFEKKTKKKQNKKTSRDLADDLPERKGTIAVSSDATSA